MAREKSLGSFKAFMHVLHHKPGNPAVRPAGFEW